jgi:hypothetical protein
MVWGISRLDLQIKYAHSMVMTEGDMTTSLWPIAWSDLQQIQDGFICFSEDKMKQVHLKVQSVEMASPRTQPPFRSFLLLKA